MCGCLESLEESVELALVVAFAERSTLVVFALTSAECNVELCSSIVVNEKTQRHNGEARRLAVLLNIANLLLVEQKFAVASGSMVVVAAEVVRGNIHIFDPHLAVKNEAERVDERSLPGAYAFDLCTGKDDARHPAVNDEVIMFGTLVLDVNACRLVVLFLSHLILQSL